MARCQFDHHKARYPSIEHLLGKDILRPEDLKVFWRVSAISEQDEVTLHYMGDSAYKTYMPLETLRLYIQQGEVIL